MFDSLCEARITFDGDLVRNIKGIRTSQDLFDDLSANPADWAVAIALEGEANAPTHAALVTRPFDYGSVITYSFDPSHWSATRFSDGRRFGVWYGSLDLETTVYETVYHWHRFLLDSYAGEDRAITGERRVCDVRCEATLADLRGREADSPELVSRTSYVFTQRLGVHLRDGGAPGLLVRSARSDGINAAVFSAEALSNVRDRCYLTYRCNPAADSVVVERQAGRRFMEVMPSGLY